MVDSLNVYKAKEIDIMENIIHPISGETGYFCTNKEKTLIDTILKDFIINQHILQVSSHDMRGGVDE